MSRPSLATFSSAETRSDSTSVTPTHSRSKVSQSPSLQPSVHQPSQFVLTGPSTAVNKPKKRTRKKSPREYDVVKTGSSRDSRIYNLKLDVNNLKQELRVLTLRRELLLTRALYATSDSATSIMRTVGRFFHGFEHGYQGRDRQPDHYALVQSITDDELVLGDTGLGFEMFMEQWRRYSEIFHVREATLRSAELIASTDRSSEIVVTKCAVNFCGIFTRAAVDTIFPNAYRDPQAMLDILGRKVTIPVVFHLYFDADGMIFRIDSLSDFFTAVCTALGGDAITAARIVEDACVSPESMIGPIPVVTPDEDWMVERIEPKKLKTWIASTVESEVDVRCEERVEPFEISDDEGDSPTSCPLGSPSLPSLATGEWKRNNEVSMSASLGWT